MDFVSNALFDGRRIRALTVVDDYSRESLAIEVGQSITGEQVVAVMNRIVAARGAPKTGSTTARSSYHARSTNGPICTRSRSTSAGPASRPTMRWSNPSTEGCATSVSTPTGFFRLTMPGAR
jgi:transposase InsO family protein